MDRKIIARTNQGQYVNYPEDIGEFAKKVAEELCKKYPDVDLFDLQFIFNGEFQLAMAVELIKYGSERERCDDKNNVS